MADISQVNLPNDNNNPYDIADTTARSGLSDKMDKTNPTGTGSFSLNRKANTTIGGNSFAEGYNTTASNYYSHAEGLNSVASGQGAHAEGRGTTAGGECSHAEGTSTTANSPASHAEGYSTTASNTDSHAEGASTIASGPISHAEGSSTTASGDVSHAEGSNTTASGDVSHAEGAFTTASGDLSHAEGYTTTASGMYSHADGCYSTANHKSQHVFGEYNALDSSTAEATARGNYVEIVGNGTADNSRSNARTLDWSGNEVLSGTIEATGFGTTLDKEVDRGGVQLTQAQYDALVNTGTVDANTTYFITDTNNTTASYAAGVTYDNTNSGLTATNVQDAIDEVSNRSFTQNLLIDTTITVAQDVTLPNFSDYDFVQVIIQGDNYNGISVFVPTVLINIPIPFSLYSINNGETFGGYSIHANGMIHNKIVHFNYLKFSGWSRCIIRAYGIKY